MDFRFPHGFSIGFPGFFADFPQLHPSNSVDPPNPVAARMKAPKQQPVITTSAVPGFMASDGWMKLWRWRQQM
jgi:hypothetical protein